MTEARGESVTIHGLMRDEAKRDGDAREVKRTSQMERARHQ